MRVSMALAAFALTVAGCTVPPATPSGPVLPPAAPDLRTSVLQVDLQPGQPTALVLLDITPELWVRALLRSSNLPAVGTDDRYWALCPWVRSEGLTDAAWTAFAFWVEGGKLQPVGNLGTSSGDTEAGSCLGSMQSDTRIVAIDADAPRSGTLAVLVTADRAAAAPPPKPVGAYRLFVGVASTPCHRPYEVEGQAVKEDARYCPPEQSTPAEPVVRAAAPHRSAFINIPGSPPCECGFTPSGQQVAGVGRLGLARTTEGAGLTWVALGFGTSRAEASLAGPGGEARIACQDRAGNAWARLLLDHDAPASFTATFDSIGRGISAHMLEIPVDLEAAGLALEPYGRSYSGWQSVESETTTSLCQ